jgi:hypothetical protein
MIGSRQFPPLLRIMHSCRGLAALRDEIERYATRYQDTGVVIIDTLAHARAGSQRPRKDIVQEDYDELIGFSHLANRLHIAIVIITHTSKAIYEDELAQVSGTFGFAGAVDAIMLLQRKRYRPEASIAVFSRRLGSERKFELHWDEAILSYVLDGEMPPQQAARTTSVLIVECLQAAVTPLSIKGVAERCQISPEVAKQRLYQLTKSGEIVSEEGRYSINRYTPRTSRNLVTAPEEKPVTAGYDGPRKIGGDREDAESIFPPLEDDSVTARNHSHQRDGYAVTAVTRGVGTYVPGDPDYPF